MGIRGLNIRASTGGITRVAKPVLSNSRWSGEAIARPSNEQLRLPHVRGRFFGPARPNFRMFGRGAGEGQIPRRRASVEVVQHVWKSLCRIRTTGQAELLRKCRIPTFASYLPGYHTALGLRGWLKVRGRVCAAEGLVKATPAERQDTLVWLLCPTH